MIASCGTGLARLPLPEKIAAPIKVTTTEGRHQTVRFEVEQDRDANSERGHLRHGDVDENDAALDDVHAEVNQEPRQEHAGHDRPKHYFPHDYFSTESRLVTNRSINFA